MPPAWSRVWPRKCWAVTDPAPELGTSQPCTAGCSLGGKTASGALALAPYICALLHCSQWMCPVMPRSAILGNQLSTISRFIDIPDQKKPIGSSVHPSCQKRITGAIDIWICVSLSRCPLCSSINISAADCSLLAASESHTPLPTELRGVSREQLGAAFQRTGQICEQ